MACLYIPQHIIDYEVIWNYHLPGAGHTERSQGSTGKTGSCQPSKPMSWRSSFSLCNRKSDHSSGSMKSPPREFCRQLLFLESKQLRQSKQKATSDQKHLDFAQTEDLSGTPDIMRKVESLDCIHV